MFTVWAQMTAVRMWGNKGVYVWLEVTAEGKYGSRTLEVP